MAKFDNAIKAILTARDVASAARTELGDIIAIKKMARRGIKRDQKLRRGAATLLTRYSTILAHLHAAQTAVEAPTLAEIRQVGRLVNKLRGLAIKDALSKATISTIRDALVKSRDLAKEVKS